MLLELFKPVKEQKEGKQNLNKNGGGRCSSDQGILGKCVYKKENSLGPESEISTRTRSFDSKPKFRLELEISTWT
ncbi:unnamed protein product [Meloidogyne enterolobii]|uniref:Uncharacterized protein n=1 Tax=Meloidogyne enterolobii TaxID=390850 RepID=A0ACB1A9F9_MELEN